MSSSSNEESLYPRGPTIPICEKCLSSLSKTKRESGKEKPVKRTISARKIKPVFPSVWNDFHQSLPQSENRDIQKPAYTEYLDYVDMTYASVVEQSGYDSPRSEGNSTVSNQSLERRDESCFEQVNEIWVAEVRARLESMRSKLESVEVKIANTNSSLLKLGSLEATDTNTDEGQANLGSLDVTNTNTDIGQAKLESLEAAYTSIDKDIYVDMHGPQPKDGPLFGNIYTRL